MNTQIFRSLKPDPQRRHQVGRMTWLKPFLSAPSLALILAIFTVSTITYAATPDASTPKAAIASASTPKAAIASASTPKAAIPNAATPNAASTLGLLPADIGRIKQRGELVVAMLATDTPPFFYEKDGKLVGLEVDLAKSMAQGLNVEIRFNREAKTFNEVVDLVAQQRADLGISKLSRTLSRAQMVRFSQPYLTLNHALIINRVAFAKLASNMRVEDAIRQYSGSLILPPKNVLHS